MLASFFMPYSAKLPSKRLYPLAEKRLLETIHTAYRDVPFYQELYDTHDINIDEIKTASHLALLPFISKPDIRAAYPDKNISKKFNINRCVKWNTTGSTGIPLHFIYSQRTYNYYRALFLRTH